MMSMKWTMHTALILCTVLYAAQATAASDKYSMQDLQALMEQESWVELLAHLNDISPSKRKGKWLKWAEAAAINELEAQANTDEPMNAVMLADNMLKNVTPLKKSRKFMNKRAEVGIKGFKSCFRNTYSGPQCAKMLRAFVALDKKNRELQFNAGKLARRGVQSWVAVEFFAPAIGKGNKTYCADEDVSIAVIDAIGRKNAQEAPAVQLATQTCWTQLKPKVMELFYHSAQTSGSLRALCPALLKKRLLTPFQKIYCSDVEK